MPYKFIDEEATADVAFEAWNTEMAEVFKDAGNALTNVMIENTEAIEAKEKRYIELENENLDLLLYNFLEQIVYYKDAEQLLLLVSSVEVTKAGNGWHLNGLAQGEPLDPARHHQMVDVKAVTLHHFSLTQSGDEWRAHVILDI
jgi:SHS2 domain-containing protein